MTHEERHTRRKNISLAIQAGESVAEVARKFQVSARTISSACQENGNVTSPRPRRYALAPSTYRIIAKLLNTQDNLAEIARQESLSRERVSQIYRRCRETGIPVPIRLRNGHGDN